MFNFVGFFEFIKKIMNFIEIISHVNNNNILHMWIINSSNIAAYIWKWETLKYYHLLCAHGPEEDISPTVIAQGAHYASRSRDKKKRHIVMWCMRKGSRRGTRTKRRDKNWAWIRAPKKEAAKGRKANQWGPHAFEPARILSVRHACSNRVSAPSLLLLSCY